MALLVAVASPRALSGQAQQRAAHAGAVVGVGADHHVLERGHLGNSRMFWNVRAMPELGDLGSACCLPSDRPSKRTSPRSGWYTPVTTLKHGGLAGAVRPDEAEDLALRRRGS